jgi:TRAP-type C4-dicarboxylate transport system permease small subunit
MERLKSILDKTEMAAKWFFYVGAVSLLIIFILIFSDVSLRFITNIPITGTDVYASYLMVAVGFLALGWGQISGAHVKMEFFGEMIYKRQKKYIDLFVLVVVITFFFVMTWQIGARAVSDAKAQILISNSNVPLPVWWQSAIATAGSGMLVISLISELIRKFLKLVSRTSDGSLILNTHKQGA